MHQISRKEFLQLGGLSIGSVVIWACSGGGVSGPPNTLDHFKATVQGSLADNMTAIGMSFQEEPTDLGPKVRQVSYGNQTLIEQKNQKGDVTLGLRFRINGQIVVGAIDIHSQTGPGDQPMVQIGDILGWELSSN